MGNISLQQIRTDVFSSQLPIAVRSEHLTQKTNDWLVSNFDQLCPPGGHIALIAVGGLGRNELSIGSDLDLLLLHDSKQASAAAELAEQLWYQIWDSGVGLDHSVRTIDETLLLAQQDLRVMFGLLDQRVVAGDQELGAELNQRTLDLWRKTFFRRLPELIAADTERHQAFGDLAHLQNPNLKESQGGLRDLVTLAAVAKSWQVEVGLTKLATAKSVLWQARAALHLVTGKNSDLLAQDLQSDVANLLDYPDSDQLLSNVYRSARSISYVHNHVIRTAELLNQPKSWFGKKRLDRKPIADGVVLADNQIQLALNHTANHALLLRVAIAAAEMNLPLTPELLEQLKNSEVDFTWDDRKRELFIELLAAGDSLINVWEALDQAGIISMMLPQWDAIRCAPQRNSVHRFTVDRHLVETVVEASQLVTEVARPDILLVASLLHDIGKARTEDHSILGAQLAREITQLMGFSKLDQEIIELLVRHHLLLPDTATKRDLEDPATIELVTQHIKSQYLLNLLHQLTIADARATSQIASSDWRLKLISQLVELVRLDLVGENVPAEPDLTDELTLNSHGVGLEIAPIADDYLITVSVPDSPGVLAKIAGFFALNRLMVRSAKTKTIGDRAISQWHVLPLFGDAPALDLLRSELSRVITGAVDVAAQLSAWEASQSNRVDSAVPVKVLFPELNSKFTVIEVRAHDRPALLYRIASVISAQQLDIVAAIVATTGATVADVFYLRSKTGEPLTPAEKEALGQAITAELAVR